MSNAALLDDLRDAVGADNILTDEQSVGLMAADLHVAGSAPAVVVQPNSSQQVADCIAVAAKHRHAVIPRGGGLSYTGGYASPHPSAISFDLGRMNQVIAIAEDDMVVTVQAGVTWKQIDEALRPRGLRLPFFGTFSGAGATVGGGLSHGALFFGSARYGSAAETVLELEVALADGTLLRTGQGALKTESKPFLRSFGPDLTGLFVHDGGALGIKTKASLRMIRAPTEEGYASFAFTDMVSGATALSQIARRDLAEEIYILDPAAADEVAGAPVAGAISAVRQAGGVIPAAKALIALARGGLKPLPQGSFSLHLVAAGRSKASVEQDLQAASRIAFKSGGQAIASTIPRMARATRFSNLDGVLGGDGSRWAALNAKVAHSDAGMLIAAYNDMLDQHRANMDECGVTVTYLASALGNHSFSFEPVFHWYDEWLPIHRHALSKERAAALVEPAPNPSARALVNDLREETVILFRSLGAASNQIGRTYPYIDALSPAPASLLKGIKNLLDPQSIMNPGVIGLAKQPTNMKEN